MQDVVTPGHGLVPPLVGGEVGDHRGHAVDEELRAAFHELMIEPELVVLRRALERHVAAGEIDADNPILDMVDRLLIGPLVAEALWLGDTPGMAERLVDEVVLPLLTRKG